jgi:cytochrome b561
MLKKYSNKLVALHWMTVPLIIFSFVMGTFVCTISFVTLMIL